MKTNPLFERVLGGTVAVLTFTVGTLVFLGWVLPQHIPSFFRWASGSVMVLYGMYRSLLLFIDWRRNSAPNDAADGRAIRDEELDELK